MCHNILNNPTLILAIVSFDQELARQLQANGCSFCGHVLDVSNYRRNPRGAPSDPKLRREFFWRWSFCCRKCRRRHTPMSIRFLGRRFYISITVVLASAIEQGLNNSRANKLTSLGISRQVLHRWLSWWRDKFPLTPAWRAIASHFQDVVQIPIDPLLALEANNLDRKLLLWLKQLKTLSVEQSSLVRVDINPQTF